MDGRGRKPVPTKKLENRGSWIAKTRDKEPQGGDIQIQSPDWMTIEAERVWDVLLPRLKNAGIVTDLDVDVLARYCQWQAAYQDMIKTCPGNLVDLKKCEDALCKLGAKLGLSPSDRVGLKVNPKDDNNSSKSYIRVG